MRILAIERELPIPAHANLDDLRREEAAAVWDLSKRGIVRDIWFSVADRRAVLMLECGSLAGAREHLGTLPLVRHQLIDFNLMELRNYDGFERLFGSPKDAAPAKPVEPPEY